MKYIAVCRDEEGNSVKITGIEAETRRAAEKAVVESFNISEVLAVITEEDADFIRRTLNGEEI